jgi:hypothetical protein
LDLDTFGKYINRSYNFSSISMYLCEVCLVVWPQTSEECDFSVSLDILWYHFPFYYFKSFLIFFFLSLSLHITRFTLRTDLICAFSIFKSYLVQRIQYTLRYTRFALYKILWRINWTRLLIYRSKCFFHTSLTLLHSMTFSSTPFLAISRILCLAFEWVLQLPLLNNLSEPAGEATAYVTSHLQLST